MKEMTGYRPENCEFCLPFLSRPLGSRTDVSGYFSRHHGTLLDAVATASNPQRYAKNHLELVNLDCWDHQVGLFFLCLQNLTRVC